MNYFFQTGCLVVDGVAIVDAAAERSCHGQGHTEGVTIDIITRTGVRAIACDVAFAPGYAVGNDASSSASLET